MSTAAILAGMSILMIGDSHLARPDYLISRLHDNLVQQGARVHSLGVCGVHAGDWLKATAGNCGGTERRGTDQATTLGSRAATIPIAALIAQDTPDLVIIVMGDTMASYSTPNFSKTWAWQQVTSLTRAIAATGTKCVWVGPNWGTEGGKYGKTFARVELVSNFLASNVAPCHYINSLDFSRPGQWATIDGQHLNSAGYRMWSDEITKALLATPGINTAEQ